MFEEEDGVVNSSQVDVMDRDLDDSEFPLLIRRAYRVERRKKIRRIMFLKIKENIRIFIWRIKGLICARKRKLHQ
jgi:hypothetical protein